MAVVAYICSDECRVAVTIVSSEYGNSDTTIRVVTIARRDDDMRTRACYHIRRPYTLVVQATVWG